MFLAGYWIADRLNLAFPNVWNDQTRLSEFPVSLQSNQGENRLQLIWADRRENLKERSTLRATLQGKRGRSLLRRCLLVND